MKVLMLMIFVLPLSGIAGFDTGNGGDVIVCSRDKEEQVIYMFDYYDAFKNDKREEDFGSSTRVDMMMDYVFEKLAKINPTRAKKYRYWYSTFDLEVKFIKNRKLIDIPDTGFAIIPEFCHLEQVAVHNRNPLPGEKRYTVDHDLFSSLDDKNKVTFFLHEFAYREFLENNDISSGTSRYSRFFVKLLISKSFHNYTTSLKSYVDILDRLNYKTFDFISSKGHILNLKVKMGKSGQNKVRFFNSNPNTPKRALLSGIEQFGANRIILPNLNLRLFSNYLAMENYNYYYQGPKEVVFNFEGRIIEAPVYLEKPQSLSLVNIQEESFELIVNNAPREQVLNYDFYVFKFSTLTIGKKNKKNIFELSLFDSRYRYDQTLMTLSNFLSENIFKKTINSVRFSLINQGLFLESYTLNVY